MKSEGLLYFSDLYLVWIAFFLFFSSFVVIAIRTCFWRDRTFFSKMANMPLESAAESAMVGAVKNVIEKERSHE